MEILGMTLMEWQTIIVLVTSPLMVAGVGYIVLAVGKLNRNLKLREYEHRALVHVLFKDNGQLEEYEAEVEKLMKKHSWKRTGIM